MPPQKRLSTCLRRLERGRSTCCEDRDGSLGFRVYMHAAVQHGVQVGSGSRPQGHYEKGSRERERSTYLRSLSTTRTGTCVARFDSLDFEGGLRVRLSLQAIDLRLIRRHHFPLIAHHAHGEQPKEHRLRCHSSPPTITTVPSGRSSTAGAQRIEVRKTAGKAAVRTSRQHRRAMVRSAACICTGLEENNLRKPLDTRCWT